MFCGNSLGQYLAPMVVYKAKNLYSNWMEGGPQGCVYEATANGWFDSRTFEIWFEKVFVPAVIEKVGTKMIIGNNLSTHFSTKVIELAAKHNIKFATLPPNSTHICKPLDIAVFGPAKHLWRSILEKWREE